LLLALGRSASIVIQVGSIVLALEYVQHATQGVLVGAYQPAIALVGATAAFQFGFERAGLFENGLAAR